MSYRVLQRVLEKESQSYTEFGRASYIESLNFTVFLECATKSFKAFISLKTSKLANF